MKELYRSVSMDPGRIDVALNHDNQPVVVKKTSATEVENCEAINLHIQQTKPLNWKNVNFKVTAPKIIDWDEKTGVAKIEFVDGENLEAQLSTLENRTENVSFTHTFINWMKESGTFWRAAAPRHIIKNLEQKQISILDFERPVVVKTEAFNSEEFNHRLHGLVHEEFCAFLFQNEQAVVFPDIWSNSSRASDESVPLNTIHGKRIKLLLGRFFGTSGETVRKDQLEFVYKFMSASVTPYLINNKPFFPLKALDKYRKAEEYVEILLQLNKIDKARWPKYLNYEA